MAEIKNSESDMSTQQKAELDKEKRKEEKKEAKRAKRQHYRELNEPPKLTVLEEVGNAVTHGIGAGLAIAGFVLLLLKSDTGLKVMASCFYGISLILMFLMSCLYHSYKSGLAVKRIWRRFDYSSIYLLIGGTFAPMYLVYWENVLGIVLFCVQWALIIAGITIICVFGPGRFRPIHYTLYFVIGWSAIMFIPDWFRNDKPLLMDRGRWYCLYARHDSICEGHQGDALYLAYLCDAGGCAALVWNVPLCVLIKDR